MIPSANAEQREMLTEIQAVLAARDPLYREVAGAVVDAARPLPEVVAELVAWASPGSS